MSRILKLSTTLALIWLSATSTFAWAGRGYIHDVAGSVSIASGNMAPRRAVVNDAVSTGTVIRTGNNSSAVLKFEDGEVASLQENTTFKVREYTFNPDKVEDSNIVFSMFKGGMRFISGLIGQRKPQAFRLATPDATIGIRGTDFIVVIANGVTHSQVLSGSIAMTNAAGTAIVSAGQTAVTSSATTLTSQVPASSVPAGTFSQITSISLPTSAPLTAPPAAMFESGGAVSEIGTATELATTTEALATTEAASVITGETIAGGAATGGAAAATTTAAVATGVSATTIAIGVGVAAGVAALVNTATTTQH